MTKPSLAKGTRDFGPDEMNKRKFIFNTLEKAFVLFGFKPIETPCIENMTTLGGKYGEEGDKLLFRILDSGDFWSNYTKTIPADTELNKVDSRNLLPHISEKGLRYDLTVPFARFVVMNRHQLTMPFRRYQMQPVWRADRPQKGRYREFWQCDADIIGSDSLLNEADLIQLFIHAFDKLGIKHYQIHVNNRKLLEGMAECLGMKDEFSKFSVVLDKLDKIGINAVLAEFIQLGVDEKLLKQLEAFLQPEPFNQNSLQKLEAAFGKNEKAVQGIEELRYLISLVPEQEQGKLVLDCSLARGLDYYTGTIFEVKPTKTSLGSIAAGGRYDNLTGIFNMPGLSGVGISFGADRIYDLMLAENLFEHLPHSMTRLLLCHLDEESKKFCVNLTAEFRKNNISTECYPDSSKLKKQLDYANSNHIPFVLIVGENERNSGKFTLKNMVTGEQNLLSVNEMTTYLNEN
jgi:histidyl-tRNA synthetase